MVFCHESLKVIKGFSSISKLIRMKFTAIILFKILFLAFADDGTENMTTSTRPSVAANVRPSTLKQKTMRECCDYPSFASSKLYLSCQMELNGQNDSNHENLHEASELECFAQKITKNGTIDKVMVEESLTHTSSWRKEIVYAVDKCEYISNGTLKENLALYYDCITEIFLDDCIEFSPYAKCISTQDRYLRNKFVYVNCTEWPRDLTYPIGCCETTTLYAQNINCELKCRQTEFLLTEKQNCHDKCALEAEGLVTQDEKLDFTAVKKVLLERTKNSTAEHDIVDDVVNECENVLRGSRKKAFSDNFYSKVVSTAMELDHCLRQKFSAKCVNFQNSYSCGRTKNFMTQCPNVLPK